LAGLILAAPLALEAQPSGKVYRIGVLESVDMAANAEYLGAFRQGLAGLGYAEGRNVVIEYRSAEGRAERFLDLASELVRLPVDVIVARGTPATLAAKQATQTIPIVMASSGEPALEGIVASLARPGGNVTGLHITVPPELGGKRLQLLKEAIPALSRIGILWNPGDLHAPLIVRGTEGAARAWVCSSRASHCRDPGPLNRCSRRPSSTTRSMPSSWWTTCSRSPTGLGSWTSRR
jgi:putative ABC transport system substrate-binding protein